VVQDEGVTGVVDNMSMDAVSAVTMVRAPLGFVVQHIDTHGGGIDSKRVGGIEGRLSSKIESREALIDLLLSLFETLHCLSL